VHGLIVVPYPCATAALHHAGCIGVRRELSAGPAQSGYLGDKMQIVLAAILAVCGVATGGEPVNSSQDRRPELLRRLDGRWTATGDVLGKPVRYDVIAGPALQGQFTEIAMNDVEQPSNYEARIFIGFDPESRQVIAHWMDSFGAIYSVPHGTGTLSGGVIEFTVPYAESAFKDRFEYQEGSDAWTLEITSQQQDKSWKHFARYQLRRAK